MPRCAPFFHFSGEVHLRTKSWTGVGPVQCGAGGPLPTKTALALSATCVGCNGNVTNSDIGVSR